jgi:chromodomain-helicase-DNA-binding protein 7
MGLGKTVQIVATLSDIAMTHHVRGPFLIVAPLSTLPHWKNEFERWSDLYPVIYHGSPAAKELITEFEISVKNDAGTVINGHVKFDVLITNYETVMSDFTLFHDIDWRYLVLDEGHRMKNHAGKCYQLMQQLTFEHCTLLTGTPVQNNVEELWSLLHFLHPDKFVDLPAFLEDFGVIEDADRLASLQQLIKPFLLRRRKADVDSTIAAKEETIIEVELTKTQKTYYRAFLHENAPTLLKQITGGSLPSLLNLMMQLRKVCNHPFLLKGARERIEEQMADGSPQEVIEKRALVESSGKMILLDKLLPKLKESGHKVLIFSQMIKVLDILEEWFGLLDYPIERIDGSVAENDRQLAIERFAQDPNGFIFLLCTRAGGVGINLTAADTVIIYDSDWNPQNDIQAQSRCHRIGQTAIVKIYRLVTRGTYELEMLDRASKKLGLDRALLDGGEVNPKQQPLAAKEIEQLLRGGVYNIANEDDTELENFCRADIEQILEGRSKSFQMEAGGDSQFSKATFDVDGNDLDLNAKDFWSQTLPHLSFTSTDELPQRRNRRSTQAFTLPEVHHAKPKHKKPIVTTNPRTLYTRIMHRGTTGTPMETALIQYCANQVTLERHEVTALKIILNVKDITLVSGEVAEAESKFIPPLTEIEKPESLVNRVVFYHQATQVLAYLQNPIDSWPAIGMNTNPLFDYAILYGIYQNGIGNQEKVLSDVRITTTIALSDKQVWKLANALIKAFIDSAKKITRLQRDYLEPEDWKKEHEELFSRESLREDEFVSLFQTLVALGFPEKEPSVIDWEFIATHSRLEFLSLSAFVEQGTELMKLAREEFSKEEEEAMCQRLGQFGTRVWIAKFRTNVRDLFRIRRFMSEIGDLEHSALSKMKPWDIAPAWWTSEQDLGLLEAIAAFGHCYCAVWLVDHQRPFVRHFSDILRRELEKLADVERVRGRVQKPKDTVGEMAFLFVEKVRHSRAMLLVQWCESRRQREKKFEENGEAIEVLEHSYIPELLELPTLPFEIGPQCEIVNLGEFRRSSDTYPVGWVSQRQYFSVKNPLEKAWYESTTAIAPSGEMVFKVKCLEGRGKTYQYHTSSGAWERLIEDIQNTRTKLRLPKRKGTSVSGPAMYGFAHPTVMACFQLMRRKQLADPEPAS